MKTIVSAGREIYWNIESWGNLVYPLTAIVLILFVWVFYRRCMLWRMGKPDLRLKDSGWRTQTRIRALLVDVLGHKRLLRKPVPGAMHLILFYAVVIFFAITTADFIHHYFFPFMKGKVYLWFSLVVDLFGLLALGAIIGFAFLRYVLKSSRFDNRPGDAVDLSLLFILILSGFWVEAHRLAATEMIGTPSYASWSVGGWILGKFFFSWGPEANMILHRLWWFLHLLIVIGAGVYIVLSFSKLMHILVAPINIFFKRLRPAGELLPIDFETENSFGATRIKDFTWKQLLDLDACTRCGRCQENCPANLSGKTLSPKNVIQDLKRDMEKNWAIFPKTNSQRTEKEDAIAPLLIGDVVSPESLWDCTTCGACVAECPVCVEHIDKMVDMRRGQVLNESEIPQIVQETLRNMELRGNPWRGAEHLREDWARELDVKLLSEGVRADWLYWVGCTGALVDRNILVTQTLAKILAEAKVDFGILGDGETCCGDPARRMGHELQFQMMAQQNIEMMKACGVRRIVTHCPHCYNTLKNEYPQLGGEFEVWHHSELLIQLIRQKRLSLNVDENRLVTYHDPCYLSRHNNIVDTPRRVLQSVPGLELVEMERCRDRSFCCGGGGGHAWMEEPVGRRINQMRAEQAIKTGADMICVSCPFCLQMMEDGINQLEASSTVMDLSELISNK